MFSNILVAVDGSETAAHAFETALQVACETGARLHPLYVIDLPLMIPEVPGVDPVVMRQALEQDGERVMRHCVGSMARLGVQGMPEIDDLKRPEEDVAHRIDAAAARRHADLIVIGTHGRHGTHHASLGSVAEQVLRGASCPVLAVPASREAASKERLAGEPSADRSRRTPEECVNT
ncbi:universal stress protein [Paraburkholderia sp. MMS20-SJTN17]|uniref:Universal stress protein n=1 Tax=Paraburkholderia translucens TaxID=2886945 RepID=A0ABS8K7P2_9BURK|nr:universal stress protein [Paraburkholderia sp. MMS20-SJTN17]MCC8400523.1 universal stress protein [Paraburkholderia sp. MMS20-SJTN17]